LLNKITDAESNTVATAPARIIVKIVAWGKFSTSFLNVS